MTTTRTIFLAGSLGWSRIQADAALARRNRRKDIAWGFALAAIVAYGFVTCLGL